MWLKRQELNIFQPSPFDLGHEILSTRAIPDKKEVKIGIVGELPSCRQHVLQSLG
jgi:hypothetical protein